MGQQPQEVQQLQQRRSRSRAPHRIHPSPTLRAGAATSCPTPSQTLFRQLTSNSVPAPLANQSQEGKLQHHQSLGREAWGQQPPEEGFPRPEQGVSLGWVGEQGRLPPGGGPSGACSASARGLTPASARGESPRPAANPWLPAFPPIISSSAFWSQKIQRQIPAFKELKV